MSEFLARLTPKRNQPVQDAPVRLPNARVLAPTYHKEPPLVLTDQQIHLHRALRAMQMGFVFEAGRLARNSGVPGVAEEDLRSDLYRAVDAYMRAVFGPAPVTTPDHTPAAVMAASVEALDNDIAARQASQAAQAAPGSAQGG